MRLLPRENGFPLLLGGLCLVFSFWLYEEGSPDRSGETLVSPPSSTVVLLDDEAPGLRADRAEPAPDTTAAQPLPDTTRHPTAPAAANSTAHAPRQPAPPRKAAVAHARRQDPVAAELAPVDWRNTRERP